MPYAIEEKTRKSDYRLLYIVPAGGGSRPALFMKREDAKEALRNLRESEARRRRFSPSPRKFKMERVSLSYFNEVWRFEERDGAPYLPLNQARTI